MNTIYRSRSSARMSLIAASVGALFLASPHVAFAEADTARISELEMKLKQSMEMIDSLAAEIKTMKASKPSAPVESSAASPDQSTRIQALERQVSQLNSAAGTHSEDVFGVPLHGFADAGMNFSNEPGSKYRGATVGSLDFYLTPRISNNIKTLIELIFEYDDTGGLATDLERVQMGYTFSDKATVWLGRFHTPYGYWNTGFHHGLQIQTSLNRPKFVDFEDKGGILPAHSVGVWANGKLELGDSSRLTYDVYGVNSWAINGNVLNMGNIGSVNHNMGGGFNIGYLPASVNGLTVGVHGLSGKIVDDAVTPNTTRLNVTGLYTYFDNDAYEGIAEYYHFNNRDLSGNTGSHNSWAGFAQLGKYSGLWTPYARVEKAVLDQNDKYFSGMNSGLSYDRQALGIRYALSSKSALKVQLDHTRQVDAPAKSYNTAGMQFAIRF